MRLGYIALSAVIGVAGVVFGDRTQRIAPIAPTEASAPEGDRVRIEHQIVQIPVIPAATAVTPRLKKAAVSRSISAPAASTRLARSQTNKRDPFLSRAVQRIVGDGRHTPQPFPRPAR
jgi:hypothetical protein